MRGSTTSMITPDILKIITANKRCWTIVIEKWRLNKLTSNTIWTDTKGWVDTVHTMRMLNTLTTTTSDLTRTPIITTIITTANLMTKDFTLESKSIETSITTTTKDQSTMMRIEIYQTTMMVQDIKETPTPEDISSLMAKRSKSTTRECQDLSNHKIEFGPWAENKLLGMQDPHQTISQIKNPQEMMTNIIKRVQKLSFLLLSPTKTQKIWDQLSLSKTSKKDHWLLKRRKPSIKRTSKEKKFSRKFLKKFWLSQILLLKKNQTLKKLLPRSREPFSLKISRR